MRIERSLDELGLDKNKGNVYLALLQLGKGTAQDIAKKAGLPRTTAYEILQHLVEVGVIGFQINKQGRVYLAQSPEKLYNILEKREQSLASIMLQLSSLYHISGQKPRVKLFEGKDGVREAWEDTIKIPNKTYSEIGSLFDLYNDRENDYMKDYVQRRVAAKVRLRALRCAGPGQSLDEQKDLWPASISELREVRYARLGFNLPLSLMIYDNNKMAIIDTQNENFGMIIESADFNLSIQNLFEVVWGVAKIVKN
jgi:HTH-type transcriptional regulator, sugar sensing transcriptional regulator